MRMPRVPVEKTVVYEHDRLADCKPQAQPLLGDGVPHKCKTLFGISLYTSFVMCGSVLFLGFVVLVQDRIRRAGHFSVWHAHLGLEHRLHE